MIQFRIFFVSFLFTVFIRAQDNAMPEAAGDPNQALLEGLESNIFGDAIPRNTLLLKATYRFAF